MNNQNKKQINYQAIFYMGVCFVGVGVVFMASVNAGLGAAFIAIGGLNMIIGGKNKDKWLKKQTKKYNYPKKGIYSHCMPYAPYRNHNNERKNWNISCFNN